MVQKEDAVIWQMKAEEEVLLPQDLSIAAASPLEMPFDNVDMRCPLSPHTESDNSYAATYHNTQDW